MSSQFYITLRLKPPSAFEEFDGMQIGYEDGYELQLKNDLAWVVFQGNSQDWMQKYEKGVSRLRSYLSAITLVKEYPFEAEPIEWKEVQVKGEPPKLHTVLGKLGKQVAQAKTPTVTREDFHKAKLYASLAEFNPYFRIAMLDYNVALSFPQEAVIFLARALEAIESHFRQRIVQEKKKSKSRDVMKANLKLPKEALNKLHMIANETTLARHARKPAQFRSPTLIEIRYCAVLCRVALDRFAGVIWHENRDKLNQVMIIPNDLNLAEEFKKKNEGLMNDLRRIESGEL